MASSYYPYETQAEDLLKQAEINRRTSAGRIRTEEDPGPPQPIPVPQQPPQQTWAQRNLPQTADYAAAKQQEIDALNAQGNRAGAIGTGVAGGIGTLVAGATEAGGKVLGPLADAASRFTGGLFGGNAAVAPSAATPRVSPPAATQGIPSQDAAKAGVTQSMSPAEAGVTQSVSIPQSTIAAMGKAPTDEQQARTMIGNPYINAELARYKAQEDQAYQQKQGAMRDHLAYVNARTTQDKAEDRARFATWEAKNSVLAGLPGNRKALLLEKSAADAALGAAERGMSDYYAKGVPGGNRNYIQELNQQVIADQKGQELAGRATRNAAEAESAKADADSRKVDSESKRQILDLQKALAAAKTPEERRAIEQKLGAMTGKGESAKGVVMKVPTGQMDQFGQPGHKEILVDPATGKVMFDPSAGPTKTAGPSLDDFLKAARADPRNKAHSDEALKDYYTKTYGAR
jgi:hypothetical protein